jgi:hypothetical protein
LPPAHVEQGGVFFSGRRTTMMDVIYIAANIVFFGASIVFIYALERL